MIIKAKIKADRHVGSCLPDSYVFLNMFPNIITLAATKTIMNIYIYTYIIMSLYTVAVIVISF